MNLSYDIPRPSECVCMSVAVLNTWTVCMASKSVARALVVGARARSDRCDRSSLDYSSAEVGPETPMETKSRFKVTAGRDSGLPLPPALSNARVHQSLNLTPPPPHSGCR